VDDDEINEALADVTARIAKARARLDDGLIATQVEYGVLNEQLWSLAGQRAMLHDDMNAALNASKREIEWANSVRQLKKLEKVDLLKQLTDRVKQQDAVMEKFTALKEKRAKAAADIKAKAKAKKKKPAKKKATTKKKPAKKRAKKVTKRSRKTAT